MKVKTIKFEQLFPTGEYANQRLSVEIEVGEITNITGETYFDRAIEAFKEGKEIVNAAFKSINPSTPNSNEEQQKPIKEINIAAGRLEVLIENTGTFEELQSYTADAIKYGLVPQYEEAHKRLKNRPS